MAPPSNDYLELTGTAFQSGDSRGPLRILCGDNPPTLTAGYAIWSVVPRPLYQGITVPQGFEPARMKVELRFGIWDGRFGWNGWDTSPQAASEVENEIDDLHWMGGGNGLIGPSPAIEIKSVRRQNGQNVPTYLVPKQYRGVSWVIDGGIDWSGKSFREQTTGGRVYQEASFTLLGYLGIGLPAPKQSTSQTGGYFRTNAAARTILAIASARSGHAADPSSLADSIRSASQNNPCRGSKVRLERKSVTSFKLPVGLDVWVPSHGS